MNDEVFMSRALELARSVPFTSPNPRVGAVVVRDGVVLGEGAHLGAGHPHAESGALEGTDAAGATLYVTLEPCAHRGRTPPCAPALVDAGVARVVVALTDPDGRVAGKGLDHLRAHGVEVTSGVLESDARRVNAAYIHQRETGLPLLTLKLALTLDGRLGAPDGSSRWITGPEARALVHERRAQVDAVLVGAGTVLADDPALTARDVDAPRQPVRIIADARGRVSPEARSVAAPGESIVATTSLCPHDRQTAYKERGAEVLVLDEDESGVDLQGLMAWLGRRGYLEVLCEGGPTLATSLLQRDLVGRLELFYGPLLIGEGPALGDLGVATMSEAVSWRLTDTRRVGPDVFCALDSPRLARLLAPSAGTT